MKFACRESYWPEWKGHYDKPVGKEPVFHVDVHNEINIVQRDDYDTYLYTTEKTAEIRKLATIINKCKEQYAGCKGGSFCINEFGQVIVPLSPKKDQYGRITQWRAPRYVGEISGDIVFYDGRIKVSMSSTFKKGSPWPYPYLGMKYRLSNRNIIYMEIQDGEDFRRVSLKKKYQHLIDSIREIRGDGPCSFIVNPWGCVIMKTPLGSDWIPVFIEKLDYKKWFDKPSY